MANNWQQISSGNTRFRHVRSEEDFQTASQTVRRVRMQSILAKLGATEGCLKRARSPNLCQLFLDRSSSCLFVRLMPAAAKHGAAMPVPRDQVRLSSRCVHSVAMQPQRAWSCVWPLSWALFDGRRGVWLCETAETDGETLHERWSHI